eukprot:XP_015583800.1 VQ motif-containing protein 22 [Ricinus communis]
MSETMSSPSDHWGQFYNHHHQQNQMVPPNRTMFVSGGGSDGLSDATVVTTTVTSTAATATQNPFISGNSSSPRAGNLSPEGRVSKPVRRRSRASRRTPTTLLNTDTTNFRAMVQQFTGGPSAPFGSGSQINAPNFSFALNPRQTHVNPSGVMVPGGFHLQYQQQQQQYQQPSQPSYMFSMGNNNSNTPSHGDHVFFQRLGNPRSGAGMEVSNGPLMDGVSSTVVAAAPSLPPPSRPPPSSSSNENRSNSFLF